MKTDPIPALRLGPFGAGMSNRRPAFRLDQYNNGNKVSFLSSIVNADITSQGSLKRRAGYQVAAAGTACHSLWSDGSVAYYADGAALVRATGARDALVATTVHSDLAVGYPVSFTKTPLGIFYSDGARLRRLDADGVDSAVGAPMFVAAPLVSATAGGALPGGRYEVCFTYRTDAGEESPTTLPVQVEVPENGIISITQLPASWPTGATALLVYATAGDASTLMRAQTLTLATTATAITMIPTTGARCSTLLMQPLPAGHLVRFHKGRILVAVQNTLYYSEPYSLLMKPYRGFIPFGAPIDIVEVVDGGVYVVADRTYFLPGDIAAAAPRSVSLERAVRGTGGVDDDFTCYWMSHSGLVRGNSEGTVQNLQDDKNAVAPALTGATLVRDVDGMKLAVSSLFGSGQTTLAAHSFMDAEVIRKGTVL